MSWVLPGEPDVLASFSLLQSILIREDFPTLLRPIKAYSGLSGTGHFSNSGLLITYTAFLICIISIIYTCKSTGYSSMNKLYRLIRKTANHLYLQDCMTRFAHDSVVPDSLSGQT